MSTETLLLRCVANSSAANNCTPGTQGCFNVSTQQQQQQIQVDAIYSQCQQNAASGPMMPNVFQWETSIIGGLVSTFGPGGSGTFGGWATFLGGIKGGAPLLALFEKWPADCRTLPRSRSSSRAGRTFITMGRCAASLRATSLRRYPVRMRRNLKRYYGAGELHFITCSCYRRQPWLSTARRRDLFLVVLERMRRRYQVVVAGYVIMPEHIHLLISEPQIKTPSTVMQAVKLGFARRVLAQARRRNPAQAALFESMPQHVWQK